MIYVMAIFKCFEVVLTKQETRDLLRDFEEMKLKREQQAFTKLKETAYIFPLFAI